MIFSSIKPRVICRSYAHHVVKSIASHYYDSRLQRLLENYLQLKPSCICRRTMGYLDDLVGQKYFEMLLLFFRFS